MGREFIRRYAQDFEIYAVSRAQSVSLLPGGIKPIVLDLASDFDCSEMPSNIDMVVHLAQSRDYKELPRKVIDVFRVNVLSTLKLLDYARKAGATKFVFASSGAIYGGSNQLVFDEHSPARPGDFYALSKLQAEQLVTHYHSFFGFAILRFFFIYGPGQKKMLIPGLIDRIGHGRPVALNGERGIKLNPIYLTDAVECVFQSLKVKQVGILNVAGPEVVDIYSVSEMISKILGKAAHFHRQTDSGKEDFVASTERLKKVLNFTARIGLEQGLKETIEAPSTALSY